METLVLNVDTLPLPIRKEFHTSRVSAQERDGNVILMPIKEAVSDDDDMNRRLAWLDRLNKLRNEAKDEEIFYIERSHSDMQPPISLND
jgi:hypothetical protein